MQVTSTLRMRTNYAQALYLDDDATLDDLHEAEATLEDTERIARRVLGGAHPLTSTIEDDLQTVRAALAAREMQTTTLMSETAPLRPAGAPATGWSLARPRSGAASGGRRRRSTRDERLRCARRPVQSKMGFDHQI